jgi:hypothetical protein
MAGQGNNSALVVGMPLWTRMEKRKCLVPTGVRTPTVQPVACRSTHRSNSAPSYVTQNVSKLQVEKGLGRAYIWLTLPTRTKLVTFAEYKNNTEWEQEVIVRRWYQMPHCCCYWYTERRLPKSANIIENRVFANVMWKLKYWDTNTFK